MGRDGEAALLRAKFTLARLALKNPDVPADWPVSAAQARRCLADHDSVLAVEAAQAAAAKELLAAATTHWTACQAAFHKAYTALAVAKKSVAAAKENVAQVAAMARKRARE